MDRSGTTARVLASDAGRRAVETGDAGTLIRLVREALGWKQSDLGREADYSQPTISRLEKNAGRIADVDVRARLADILAIPRSAVGLLDPVYGEGQQRTVADMRRSDFLRGMVGAAASLALPSEITSATHTASAPAPSGAVLVHSIASTSWTNATAGRRSTPLLRRWCRSSVPRWRQRPTLVAWVETYGA
jgi:transcriptional regulator with XRE-family HTH domain